MTKQTTKSSERARAIREVKALLERLDKMSRDPDPDDYAIAECEEHVATLRVRYSL